MKKSASCVLTAAAVVASAVFLGVPAANADLVTRCVGEGGAVTVPGDLVVPAGESCSLTDTTVTGDVRVRASADLIAADVTVGGRIVGAGDAYVELVESSVAGELVLTGAFGAVVDTSGIGGRVLTRAADGAPGGFVYAVGASLAGDLVSRAGEVYVEDSEIAGAVNSTGSLYTDLYGSFIDGRLTVRQNVHGSIICASAVQGSARFVDNPEIVQMGADGPSAECSGGSYWGTDVVVRGNTGGVYVDNNILNGTLRLTNNHPAVRLGETNRIREGVTGTYTDWDGLTTAAPSQLSSGEATVDRAYALRERLQERQDSAERSVEIAGTADLR